MNKTLNMDEIDQFVADTLKKIEAKKGTNTVPYIQMDLSMYTHETLEAIKEAFVAADIRFSDRWNNGSDFVVQTDAKREQPIFRGNGTNKTLNADEINKIVAETVAKMEAKKETNTVPYIQMDFSMYTPNTLEAIKEAFVAAGIHFSDRWNNGSDFIVQIDVKCAEPIFRRVRRDAFTKCGEGIFKNSGQTKKPSLSAQIQSASNRAASSQSAAKAAEKEFTSER